LGIVVRVDGSELRGAQGLQASLDSDRIGQSVEVDLVRGGKLVQLNVTVGERPEK
jgi:S1-C subfamily serine protease